MGGLEFPASYNAARHFIDRHVREGRSKRVAYVDDRGVHTYADLVVRTNRAARFFARLGILPEQRVMLLLVDSMDFVAAFFGAMKIGAVPVPINTLLTPHDVAYLVADSRAAAVVVSGPLFERLRPAFEGARSLRHVVVREDVPAGAEDFDAGVLAESAEPLEPTPMSPDDVAFWLYSSGSTGRPKGVMHLMRSLEMTARRYADSVLEIDESDRCFSAAKLFFAYGLGNAMTFPLHVGASTVLVSGRPTPPVVAGVFHQHRPTLFFGVPTLYAALLASDETLDTSRLRLCVSAGEALPADIYERWKARFGAEILDGLGSTEMLHIFLSNRAGEVLPGTTGKPVHGYRVKIVDELRVPVPDGEIGALWVEGPSAPLAYWNQREKSLDTFEGRWTRTGDSYWKDAQGFFHYAGRADDMLKVGGNWVSPFEVEATLAEHPAVLEAAVVGHKDAEALVKPKAFVVLTRPELRSDALAAELQAFVKERLAPYKYPRWVEFVDDLPKTATGKIQRFVLRGA